MRFHLGAMPEADDFEPDQSWHLVQEPKIRSLQLTALPIGIAVFGIVTGLWLLLTPLWGVLQTVHFPLPIHYFALCLIGVLIVHELIHAAFHPGFGLTRRSVIGFLPLRLFLYAVYTGELTRRRCLTYLVAPFIFISVIPLIVSVTMQTAVFWVAYISVLNAFVSCGDMLATWLILTRIPTGTIINVKDGATYFKRRLLANSGI